jgi:hypothetical protein
VAAAVEGLPILAAQVDPAVVVQDRETAQQLEQMEQ